MQAGHFAKQRQCCPFIMHLASRKRYSDGHG
jgi:hypothetical protein